MADADSVRKMAANYRQTDRCRRRRRRGGLHTIRIGSGREREREHRATTWRRIKIRSTRSAPYPYRPGEPWFGVGFGVGRISRRNDSGGRRHAACQYLRDKKKRRFGPMLTKASASGDSPTLSALARPALARSAHAIQMVRRRK